MNEQALHTEPAGDTDTMPDDIERRFVERSVERFRKWLSDNDWLIQEHDLTVAMTMVETATRGSHVRIMKLFFDNILLPQTQ